MLRVELPNRTLKIVFQHRPARLMSFPRKKKDAEGLTRTFQTLIANKVTWCHLMEEKDRSATLLVSGSAFCSLKDTFVKAVGRKRALEDALSRINLSKPERAQVWQAYLKDCR